MKEFGIAEVTDRLAREIRIVGTAKEYAARNGLSAAYVSDVLHRRREPGKKILEALGIERVIRYAYK